MNLCLTFHGTTQQLTADPRQAPEIDLCVNSPPAEGSKTQVHRL